jgi:hypothetical protein
MSEMPNVYIICENCNQEYIVNTVNGVVEIHSKCSHCGKGNTVWVRLETKKGKK